MKGKDEHPEWLGIAMEFTLRRLVRQPKFAEEIDRLRLSADAVAHAVALDKDVRVSARRAYEPMTNRSHAAAVHKAQMPTPWPEEWTPTSPERKALRAAAAVPVTWLLILELAGAWLPGAVVAIGWLVVLAITWFLAWYGLPPTVGRWLSWARTQVRLIFGIPAGLAAQQRQLRDEVLVPELRAWLHRKATPSFALKLRLRDASGLTMPPDQLPLVRTDAVRKCVREVNRSMAAAVGLAGTRGAGKTTIVERAVRNEFTEQPQRGMLGVMTTAPVRYDARDFVLHIHSRVCRAVLDFLDSRREGDGTETQREWRHLHRLHRFRASVRDVGRGVVRAAILFGLAASIASLMFHWRWDTLPDLETAKRTFAPLAAAARTDPDAVLLQLTWRHGAVVLCFGLAVAALLTLMRRVVWHLLKRIAALFWRWVRLRARQTRHDPRCTALRRLAEQHLRRIRFLQTYTEGWSGKVSGPRGMDLGLSRSLARTEQPWTHPEVVERLREFLELVVDVLGAGPNGLSGIVVGIDELDKIAEPEEAHRFLNEIKGIFGVQGCLFLVSVSDDALTAFERRGMPARDAFDSALTTMINVQPFTLEESETWLAQRALGIPKPFVWLCHCLSGGLPRDLGRVAIALHDLSDTCTRLSEITRALVRNDLTIKVRALGHSARQATPTDEDDGQPHALISDLQLVTGTELTELEKVAWRIWPDPDRTPRTELENLRAETACYLLFCEALVEVFHDELDRATLRSFHPSSSAARDAEAAGVVLLAQARQYMAIDTPLARNTLADFRARMSAPD